MLKNLYVSIKWNQTSQKFYYFVPSNQLNIYYKYKKKTKLYEINKTNFRFPQISTLYRYLKQTVVAKFEKHNKASSTPNVTK